MRRLWLIFSQTVTVLLAAWFVVATLKPDWLNRRPACRRGGRPWSKRPRPSPAPAPAGSLRAAAQKGVGGRGQHQHQQGRADNPQQQRPLVPVLLRRPGAASRRPAWAAA
jgi:serine protease DegQ